MRDKRKRFIELTEKRVTRAIHVLRLVGNLSNRNNYQYNDEDVRKILRVLEAELKELRRRFADGDSPKLPEFKL